MAHPKLIVLSLVPLVRFPFPSPPQTPADPSLHSQLLAYLSSTNFIKNIPFHLNPPRFSASNVRLPGVSSSSNGDNLEQFTLRSEPFFAASKRMAYCEDAIPF